MEIFGVVISLAHVYVSDGETIDLVSLILYEHLSLRAFRAKTQKLVMCSAFLITGWTNGIESEVRQI